MFYYLGTRSRQGGPVILGSSQGINLKTSEIIASVAYFKIRLAI